MWREKEKDDQINNYFVLDFVKPHVISGKGGHGNHEKERQFRLFIYAP